MANESMEVMPIDLNETHDNENGVVLIEDILVKILEKLNVQDLINCRLVNKLWCLCATKNLKRLTAPIKLVRDCKNLIRFTNMLQTHEPDRPLPFGRFHIDLSQRISQADPFLEKLFKQLRTEKCHKLKILHQNRPETNMDARRAATNRQGSMGFQKLENLEFQIRIYQGFNPEFANMGEILRNSYSLRKVNTKLSSLMTPAETVIPYVSNVIKCLTNSSNNFRNVTTMGLDYSYLCEDHLKILTAWKHPLKNLALGTFDLKPSPNVGFPTEAFKDFLTSRARSLQHLKIKVDKEYPWEDMMEENIEMNGSDEEEVRIPFGPRNCNPINVTFPKMPALVSLEIMAANIIDAGWAWRLDRNSFPELLPNLKKFSLTQFRYSKGDYPGYLPRHDSPATSVEEVCVPDPKDICDPLLILRVIFLFPRLKSLEMHYNNMTLKTIFVTVPTLEKLILHLGEELISLDSVLTGVPRLGHQGAVLSEEEARNFNMEQERTLPSIANLKQLKELFITTEDYYVRITDVTGYHVFLKMPNFRKLKVHAYPWEDCTQWMFSPACEAAMTKQISLDLQIFTTCKREKLFSYL